MLIMLKVLPLTSYNFGSSLEERVTSRDTLNMGTSTGTFIRDIFTDDYTKIIIIIIKHLSSVTFPFFRPTKFYRHDKNKTCSTGFLVRTMSL